MPLAALDLTPDDQAYPRECPVASACPPARTHHTSTAYEGRQAAAHPLFGQKF